MQILDKISDELQNKIVDNLETYELNCCHAFKQVQNKESDYARVDLPLGLDGYIEIEKSSASFFMARVKGDNGVIYSTMTFNYSDVDGQNNAYFLDFIKVEFFDFLKIKGQK